MRHKCKNNENSVIQFNILNNMKTVSTIKYKFYQQQLLNMKEQFNFFDDKIYLSQQTHHKFNKILLQPFRFTKRKIPHKQRYEYSKQDADITKKDTLILQSIMARVNRIKQREASLQQKDRLQNQLISILPIVQMKMNSYNIRKSENELIQKKKINDTRFENNKKQQNQSQQDQENSPSNSLIIKKKMLNQLENKQAQRYVFLPHFHKIQKQRSGSKKLLRVSHSVIQNKQLNQELPLEMKSARKSQYLINNNNKKSIAAILSLQKIESESYLDFVYLINWTNSMYNKYQTMSIYKIFVNKGNNHNLIKNAFKKRFWWKVADSFDDSDVNLYWTQNRNLKFIKKLPQQATDTQKTKIYKKAKTMFLNAEMKKLIPSKDLTYFQKGYLKDKSEMNFYSNPRQIKIHNHLEFNWNLSNKKMLYKNLKEYYQKIKKDPFQYIPVTFHVRAIGDQGWNMFTNFFQKRNKQIQERKNKKISTKFDEKNAWIIKPGENTNRGNGIQVADTIQQIQNIISIKKNKSEDTARTYIIQIYVTPFLFHKRKFDIRCYMLITSINRKVKGYWYEDGYIRTSSKEFNYKNLSNRMIHLTNDAVQKYSDDYGKYQPGNKISFLDFQKYLNHSQNTKLNFKDVIQPRMIELAKDSIKSTYYSLDQNNREYTFQIFGLDFLIDENFKVWLIQINTNPCLEISSSLLGHIIPPMIQNSLRIAVDPIFPPPKQWMKAKIIASNLIENNKFCLIFNSEQQQKKHHLKNRKQLEQIESEYDQSQFQN